MVKRVVGCGLLLMVGCLTPTPAPDVQPVESVKPADASSGDAPAAPAHSGAATPGDAGAAPPPGPAADDAGAGVADASPDGASAPPEELSKDNKVKPALEGEDLTERAKALFEGIAKNEPSLADPFWFPREPFVPLKDVKDPGKYWDNLHKAYQNDVKALHRKRKGWNGAQFKGFEVGSTPKWVPPGDEANKIGYYRSFHGKLKYEIDGTTASIDVHTIISWQGRWYITHLSKFKK